jgi:hypothetical protein
VVAAVAEALPPDWSVPVTDACTVPLASGAHLVETLPDQFCEDDADAMHVIVVPLWVHPCQTPDEPLRPTPTGTERRSWTPPTI